VPGGNHQKARDGCRLYRSGPHMPHLRGTFFMNKYLAEFVGTLLLVFVGLGSAIFDGKTIGPLGIGLAFGITLLAMVYVIGPVSGCHINPAVTLGAALAGRIKGSEVIPYWIAQFLGGICGFGFLALILMGAPNAGPDLLHTSAAAVSNGFGDHSPNGYGLLSALVVEIIVTAVLVVTVLGATSPAIPAGFAGIPIGFALFVGHLVAIPIDNASINPARSLAPAIYAGGWAMGEIWLFIVAPLLGGILAALLWRVVQNR
jgi:aquaporin Z